MKTFGRIVFVLALIAVGVLLVVSVPGIITRARWYGFTQRAARFMSAADRRDSMALREQAVEERLVAQALGLRGRRPALVRAATSSLTLERAQREGDTILVALRTTHSSCTPPGDPDRIRMAFVLLEGEYRVAWLSTILCRNDR